MIVIGSLAAALQGAPQRPRPDAVEVVASDRDALLRELEAGAAMPTDDEERFNAENRRWRWTLPAGELIVADRLVGAGGYPDLRRDVAEVAVGDRRLQVVSPRDLLRLIEASGSDVDRAYAPGLRALLRQPAAG